jgi:type VI secretion system protein ImpH
LGLRAHSAALIETVLRYYFKHNRVFIEQWVERTVEIAESQRNRLGGANSVLGHDQVLGSRVADRSGKFRVHVQGLGWGRFHGFLPTGADYPLLCSLVQPDRPRSFGIRRAPGAGQGRDQAAAPWRTQRLSPRLDQLAGA